MTNSLDLLRQYSQEAMEKADAQGNRPAGRPAFTEAEADIHVEVTKDYPNKRDGTPVLNNDGSRQVNDVVRVTMTNVQVFKVAEGRDPVPGGHIDQVLYDIGLSKRSNSSLGRHTAHIAAIMQNPGASIADIDGKRCKITEDVAPAPKDKDGNVVRGRDGYDLKPTFYYRFTPTGVSVGNNGASAGISEELKTEALAFMVGKTDEQMRGEGSRYFGQKNADLAGAIALGRFQTEMVAAGKATVVDGYYHVEGIG